MSQEPESEGDSLEESLAKTLLVFSNPDKLRHRTSGLGEFMPDWPFRLLLAGPPGVGKRNLALNLAFRLEPPPSAIHIAHYDPHTREYDELETLGAPIYFYGPEDLPTIENIAAPDPPPVGDSDMQAETSQADPSVSATPEELAEAEEEAEAKATLSSALGESPLVIFDEITKDILPAAQASRLERLLNYGSTHKNTSVITSIQDITNIPPKSRRAFDHFALWKQPDDGGVTLAANRVGVPPDLLRELFGLCYDKHDSIWVDTHRSPEDPYRFRLNWLTPIRATEKIDF